MKEPNQGEGNQAADRRYREAVRKTVESTTDEARAAKARNLSEEEKQAARLAEQKAKARAATSGNTQAQQ